MLIPTVNWAQRKDKLYITLDIQDAEGVKTGLENVNGVGKLTFSGIAGDERQPYTLELELLKEVDVSGSRVSVTPRCVFYIIMKTQEGSGHWPRLTKDSGRHLSHIRCDWNHWVDEDEEDETEDKIDFGQYNLTPFGES